MRRSRWGRTRPAFAVPVLVATVAAVVAATAAAVAGLSPRAAADAGWGTLSEHSRLADRRFVLPGGRAYEVGAGEGSYPATGWHIRGEMGGFWSPPIKLLDGVWFAADGTWLTASRFTEHPGDTTMTLAGPRGMDIQRTDVVPDGSRAALIGLRFPAGAGTVRLTVDAHSELLSAYPWTFTTPSQATANHADTGSFDGRHLVFRDQGGHDWAALLGSALTPSGHAFGPGMRGPQGDVICGDPTPAVCDDGPYGKGVGGQLTYDVRGGQTVWFAVA